MATTTASSSTAGSRVTDWIYLAALLVYVAVLVWVALGRPPVKATVLHAVMRTSQTSAAALGHIGLHAEAAYRRNVSPDGSPPP